MRKTVFLLVFMSVLCLVGYTSNAKAQKPLVWALPENLVIAVDVPSYDGDIIKSGAYTFNVKGGRSVSARQSPPHGEVPIVFNLYVSPTLYKSTRQLKKKEMVGSVGGRNPIPITLNLPSGSYLYIVYYKILPEPNGYLEITKQ